MLIILPNRPLSLRGKLIINGYIPSINTSIYTPKSIKNFNKLSTVYLVKVLLLLD
jgi:hypothetical protein